MRGDDNNAQLTSTDIASPLLGALLLCSLGWIGLACSQPQGLDVIRSGLAGVRTSQPRLTGLGFSPCSTSSDQLIPVVTCQDRPTPSQLHVLTSLARRSYSPEATSDDLHAGALAALVASPHHEATVRSAIATLTELSFEGDSMMQARALSDLAAAHLLLAEVLQSPLGVVAALEAALHALELNPEIEEAQFNLLLASWILGLSDVPGMISDPWLAELHERMEPSLRRTTSSDQDCLMGPGLLLAIDAWSASILAGTENSFPQHCSPGMDRFFDDLEAKSAVSTQSTAEAWRLLRNTEASLYSFDLKTAERGLDLLERLELPEPIEFQRQWLASVLLYQRTYYRESLVILDSLAQLSIKNNYFELAARAVRMASLIFQIQGDYGAALTAADRALLLARRSGSQPLESAVLTLLIELQELVGREEEAWRAITAALRGLDPAALPLPRILCLQSAARLADDRGFTRVSRLLHDQAVAIGSQAGPVPQVGALRERGEWLADRNQNELARNDLNHGRRLIPVDSEEIGKVLQADLLFLEGRVAPEIARRREALEQALEHFRAVGYERKMMAALLTEARLDVEAGDLASALTTLEEAADTLRGLVDRAGGWSERAALVAAARPIADELVGLSLHSGGTGSEVFTIVSDFLTLRSGRERQAIPSEGGQRLTYFVRQSEVLIFLETPSATLWTRSPVGERQLADLRALLMRQLRAGVASSRLDRTLRSLSELLVKPIAPRLTPGEPLVIVTDDALAGLPFTILPWSESQWLIDQFTISYSIDHHRGWEGSYSGSLLAVGFSAAADDLPRLPWAEEEARQVAKLHGAAELLLGASATASVVREKLAAHPATHVASHFVVNDREPLRSFLVLSGEGGSSDRLRLADLLTARPAPRLLFLSGCDTGRSLPPSAHGLASLAQAFAMAGVERTVLSLWPIEDKVGAELGASFYGHLLNGASAAEALRHAQLEHRSMPPSLWAPLAVFQ